MWKEGVDMYVVETYGIDTNVREAALLVQDTNLLGKLSAGDMVAIEAKYHAGCLTTLYNHNRAHLRQRANETNNQSAVAHSITFE